MCVVNSDYEQSLLSLGNSWSSAGTCCTHIVILDTKHRHIFRFHLTVPHTGEATCVPTLGCHS